MLKYSLVENLLTKKPNDFIAKAQPVGSYDKEAIITEMLHHGTLLTRTDIAAVLNGFEETILYIIGSGSTVNTPLFKTSFSISGVFEGPMDNFDSNRHKIKVNLTKGTRLRDRITKVNVEKTETVIPEPQILEVKDTISGKVNEQLTPGGIVELFGHNIKISGKSANCGLWFVPASGEAIKAQIIVRNKPSTLIAMITTLAQGNYQLKVVTQFNGSGYSIKMPKTSIYKKSLKVNPD